MLRKLLNTMNQTLVLQLSILWAAICLAGCQNSADNHTSEVSSEKVIETNERVPADQQPNHKDSAKMHSQNNQHSVNNPRVTVGKATSSRSLRDISKEQNKLSDTSCEEQFKNKQGVCEVPNHPFPKSLRGKSTEDDIDNQP